MISHSTSSTSSAKDERERLLDKDYCICLNVQLGKGGFGQIFLGKSINDGTKVAVKCEEQSAKPHLLIEYHILHELEGGKGIPKTFKIIKGHRHNYLIMQLLGKSLDKLFSDCDRDFTVKTVAEIGYQMIQRIDYIHSKGYIHRDIKPGNFLLGTGKEKKVIFIIDFGLSKKYFDKEKNTHIPFKDGKGLTGTARYVSLFTHKGYEQSRRDDIECIAYNLIYFAKGKLPWQGVRTKNKKLKHKKIMDKKIAITPEELCDGLPNEFPTLLRYARELEFEEKPDYKSILVMFENLIRKNGGHLDWEFDWEISKSEDDKEKLIGQNHSI